MTIQEFNFTLTLLDAFLWQYNNATRIFNLMNQKYQWYLQNYTQFWIDWYNNVFNLETANSFGLAVWSIILNVPLFIELEPDPEGKPIWGFNEVTVFPDYINDNFNFNNGSFTNTTLPFRLDIEEQRLVLRLRYFQLITRGAVLEVNQFLVRLFENYGPAYLLDGLNMTIKYVFNFNMRYELLFVLKSLDILPRCSGVDVKYVILDGSMFGFNEVTTFPDYINVNQNFNNGNFYPDFLS